MQNETILYILFMMLAVCGALMCHRLAQSNRRNKELKDLLRIADNNLRENTQSLCSMLDAANIMLTSYLNLIEQNTSLKDRKSLMQNIESSKNACRSIREVLSSYEQNDLYRKIDLNAYTN